MKLKVKMLPGEHWWGGDVNNSNFMPYDCTTEKFITTAGRGRITCQSAPFFLSDKGRYIWSDKSFKVWVENGELCFEGEGNFELYEGGSCLRDAYLHAMENHFPISDIILYNKTLEKDCRRLS